MNRKRQRGAALLLLMLLVLVSVTALLVNRLSSVSRTSVDDRMTSAALAEAKTALLAYAAIQPDVAAGWSVRLPCPDVHGGDGLPDGEAHAGDCGAAGENVMGRLPWRTLDAPLLKDGSGACLWYAVSGDYKASATSPAALLNPDSKGRFQLVDAQTGAIVDGALPEDRPVAVVMAAGRKLAGQDRDPPGEVDCGATWDSTEFFETAAALGLDNSALLPGADRIDSFVVDRYSNNDLNHDSGGTTNDRFVVVRAAELAALQTSRNDYAARTESLGLAVAACIADYALNNPGGVYDRRLPWAAELALPDYRVTANYDDATGRIAGRLPDVVDDSNLLTANPLLAVLSNCDPLAVPAWTPETSAQWQNWKDHFFLFLSPSYSPSASTPTACTDCLTVNGGGPYAAVVAFAGSALPGQLRRSPPVDSDTANVIGNYLEGRNALAFAAVAPPFDLESGSASAAFNDRLFCIDTGLTVTTC